MYYITILCGITIFISIIVILLLNNDVTSTIGTVIILCCIFGVVGNLIVIDDFKNKCNYINKTFNTQYTPQDLYFNNDLIELELGKNKYKMDITMNSDLTHNIVINIPSKLDHFITIKDTKIEVTK